MLRTILASAAVAFPDCCASRGEPTVNSTTLIQPVHTPTQLPALHFLRRRPSRHDRRSRHPIVIRRLYHHYPTTYPRKFNFQSQLVPVTGLAHIEFKVHADLNAALGPRILTAKLTFQPIQIDSGIGPVHEAVVEIPITIVDRHTSVKKTGYPYHHMPKAEEVALIVALVPLAVAVMPIYLACMGSNNCPD